MQEIDHISGAINHAALLAHNERNTLALCCFHSNEITGSFLSRIEELPIASAIAIIISDESGSGAALILGRGKTKGLIFT